MQVNQYSIFIACESLLVIQKWMMTSYGIRSEQAQYFVFHSNTYNIVVLTYISYKALVVSNLIIHENYTLLYTTLSTSTAQFVHVIKVIYMCLGIPIGCVMSNSVSTLSRKINCLHYIWGLWPYKTWTHERNFFRINFCFIASNWFKNP